MDSRVEFVKEREGAREFRLTSNGLRVLFVPHSVGEVVAFMAHYNIGSRNEGVGHTGSTHFLEHLMFKGSKNFPKGTRQHIEQLFAQTGAISNASTGYDRTGYFEIIMPEHLDLFMRVEADRMRNATFTDEDRQDEMKVVRSELEMGENDPDDTLGNLVVATAVREHPYHHPVIGWRSDIEGVATERFREFYDKFYYPNNALLILVGNVDEDWALGMILEYFGNIEPSPEPTPQVYTKEPPQQGERRINLKRAGGNGIIHLAWMAPGAAHPDFAPLRVLSYVLAKGNSSLLKHKFVDSGLVARVSTTQFSVKDPFPFFIEIDLLREGGHVSVEREMRKYLESLQNEGISDERVERAKIIAYAQEWYRRDNPKSMLNSLSSVEGAGDWELYYTIPADMQRVTVDDVMRVFRQYIQPDNLTVGWYIPTKVKASLPESTADQREGA